MIYIVYYELDKFLFCIGVIAWLNYQLGHYFVTRSVVQMIPFLDQFIVNFYDKIRGKILNRYEPYRVCRRLFYLS